MWKGEGEIRAKSGAAKLRSRESRPLDCNENKDGTRRRRNGPPSHLEYIHCNTSARPCGRRAIGHPLAQIPEDCPGLGERAAILEFQQWYPTVWILGQKLRLARGSIMQPIIRADRLLSLIQNLLDLPDHVVKWRCLQGLALHRQSHGDGR